MILGYINKNDLTWQVASPYSDSHKELIHSAMEQPLGAICGSVSCPRTVYHLTAVVVDQTTDPLVKTRLTPLSELQLAQQVLDRLCLIITMICE